MMRDTFGHLFPRLGVNEKKDAMAVVHRRQGPVAGRQISLFGRQFSVMEVVLPMDRGRVSTNIVAGVTLAALAIPEVMGYTRIAGMPVITGLYYPHPHRAVRPVGAVSPPRRLRRFGATAAIMAAGLVGLAATASPPYVALAGLLALITAAPLLIARLIGLGFLADFLSHTVLIGFLTGVGIHAAIAPENLGERREAHGRRRHSGPGRFQTLEMGRDI